MVEALLCEKLRNCSTVRVILRVGHLEAVSTCSFEARTASFSPGDYGLQDLYDLIRVQW